LAGETASGILFLWEVVVMAKEDREFLSTEHVFDRLLNDLGPLDEIVNFVGQEGSGPFASLNLAHRHIEREIKMLWNFIGRNFGRLEVEFNSKDEPVKVHFTPASELDGKDLYVFDD
jgi:hypothetical protein